MVTYRQFVAKTLKLAFYIMLPMAMLSFVSFFKPFLFIAWSSWGLFTVLTLITSYYNQRSVKKPFFLNIYLMTVAGKLVASFVFFGLYYYWAHPIKWVILPFMILFAIFKAFEVVMIIQFSKDLEEISEKP